METISQLCKCSKWVHSLSGVISGLIEGRQISGRLLKGANIFFWCEEKEKEKDELRRINTSSIQRWELNCTCASWRGSRGPWILPHCASWVLHVLLREHLSIRQAIQYVVYMLYWGWPPPPTHWTSECCLSETFNACRKIGWPKTANWSRTIYTFMLLYFTNKWIIIVAKSQGKRMRSVD